MNVMLEMQNEMDMAIRDVKRLAANTARQRNVERAAPFAQNDHDALHDVLDAVASDWVGQLQEVRRNAERIEHLVIERVGKIKADVTQLFVLGAAVRSEARRGEDVNAKLLAELAKLESRN